MSIGKKVKIYMDFTKFRLSSLVLVSALSGYLFVGASDGLEITWLLLGGWLVTSASNGSNQIWERELDILMKRTGKRPLPAGTMGLNEALIVVTLCLLLGLWMLYQLNLGSMLLGLAAFISYVFIYTPMKRVTPWAVFVGAFPGAIPPMLGAVAGSDDFGLVPGVLFFVQFVWQFPHFWAIAWVAHKDYSAAGFKLLPSDKGPTKFTALQTIIYSTLMIPIGFLPYLYKISGVESMWILLVCNLFMVFLSIRLFIKMDIPSARKVMFSSYFYLMIVFLSLYANKQKRITSALAVQHTESIYLRSKTKNNYSLRAIAI